MLKVNDTVLYGTTGVCTVSNIEQKTIGKVTRQYYVLKPVSHSASTVYVPADNEALLSKIRDVLSVEEINDILQKLKSTEDIWIENEEQRKQRFNEIILSGDRLGCLLIIKTLKNHQNELSEKGKRLHLADERLMKEAQRLIDDEFAFVLGKDLTEIPVFIRTAIK